MAGELLTVDGQIEWRGVVLGTGSYFRTKQIIGWLDLPAQRGSNPALPSRHGAYPGRKLSAERLIEFQFKTKGVSLNNFPTAVALLRRITTPTEDPQEEPLVIRLDGESWLTWARCIRRSIPTDKHYAQGYAEGAIQWEATDPRIYSMLELSSGPVALAVAAGGGLDFSGGGLSFASGGLDFGSGTSGGRTVVTNLGDAPTWPRLEIAGPCTGPIVTFPGDRKLSFDPAFVVGANQTLIIDTKPGTARTVLINGVSMRSKLWTRQWTAMSPGVPTEIKFSAASYDAGARLNVFWRHAKH